VESTKKTEATNPKHGEGGERKESPMAHHRFLLPLLVLSLAAASVDAEDPLLRQVVGGGDDNDLELNAEHHFATFVRRFGKSYRDADEHAYRLSVFKANLRRARRHQLLDPSAEHGVTKFSDLTPAEFRRTYLGLRKSRRALLRELGGSAHEAPVLPTDGLPDDFDWRDHGAVGPVKNQVCPGPDPLIFFIS
jgi:cathepsin F